ncbi:ankyrin repeat domain-containing protein 26-like [Octodon degus]|uniref:Ankyrin repeat domain-containing protein 26-like n=1 Tax=Octodon degus TaxID=10160 RepID=A0A6P6EAA6_OCTDE|nr:ankyrin repeat domain-containing protein 26-like [Octodon degus]
MLTANLSKDDKEQLKKLTELKQSLEYTLDEEMKKNGELKKELTGFKKLFKMIKTKLNEQEDGEFCFQGDLTSSESEIIILLHTLMHKTQVASLEQLEQLRKKENASVKKQMELRIKDLELELSKTKSQEDSAKIELEKYRQLYVEEFKATESLFCKLNRAIEFLEEANTKFLEEKQQYRSLLSNVNTRPVLECPSVRNFDHNLGLPRSFHTRENLVVPRFNPQPSNNSMENYLTKMHQVLENSVSKEERKANAELHIFKLPLRRSANKSS